MDPLLPLGYQNRVISRGPRKVWVGFVPEEFDSLDDEIRTSPEICNRVLETLGAVSEVMERGQIVKEAVGLFPQSHDYHPIIGSVPGLEGAFLSTGHGPWGVMLAPGSGEALADRVLGFGSEEAQFLEPFDPSRFLDL
mmetsp:Transcript_25431/g.39886  ORF Transcript_25431/g.39886 Transcript_25431/m.39886 type:complete len:138 (+) Transcript_25431:1-414(+)